MRRSRCYHHHGIITARDGASTPVMPLVLSPTKSSSMETNEVTRRCDIIDVSPPWATANRKCHHILIRRGLAIRDRTIGSLSWPLPALLGRRRPSSTTSTLPSHYMTPSMVRRRNWHFHQPRPCLSFLPLPWLNLAHGGTNCIFLHRANIGGTMAGNIIDLWLNRDIYWRSTECISSLCEHSWHWRRGASSSNIDTGVMVPYPPIYFFHSRKAKKL
jgi:hypothetical protein